MNWGVPRTIFSFDDLLLTAEQKAARTQIAIPSERLANSVTLLGRADAARTTIPLPLQPTVSASEFFTSALDHPDAVVHPDASLLDTVCGDRLLRPVSLWIPGSRDGRSRSSLLFARSSTSVAAWSGLSGR